MKASRTFLAWMAAAALLVGLGVTISFLSFSQIGDAANDRQHAATVLRNGNQLMAALVDAETGQRGYLLTGDEAYLAPYLAVRDNVAKRLQTLRELTTMGEADRHLDALVPLVDAKLGFMSRVIESRRSGDLPGALEATRGGEGIRLMDAIRREMGGFIGLEEATLAQREAEFQLKMTRLFNSIVVASLLTVLLALAFVYFIRQRMLQGLKNQVHDETRHLLQAQEATNRQLEDANGTLQLSEEKLTVTLNSIGDAVIATDLQARVTLLNPLAQRLTGWTEAQAQGKPVADVFHIVSKATRKVAVIPVMETLAKGTVQGLANHTVLIARDGRESDIADSCAPIRDAHDQVIGAVLVFRDVTREYEARHALGQQKIELEMQNQELRHSQAALDLARARYFDLYDLAPVGYCTLSVEGLVREANLTAANLLGPARSALVGQPVAGFVFEKDADMFHRMIRDLTRTGLPQAVELRMRRNDGTLFWVHLAASSGHDEGTNVLRIVITDIDARRQAEAALAKADALQAAIFNSASFSCMATDAHGVIQIFNVGAERMLGYAAVDVMNRITPAEISDPQEVIQRAQALSVELGTPIQPGFEALVFKASRGIEDIYDLTYLRKDGSRLPALVSVTALRDDRNAIIGYLLISTDNTARRQTEAERVRLEQVLQDKNTELERARAVADKANVAKSDFLSSMSHELRTPLNAILGFTQLLASGTPAPSPVQKRNLEQILKAGWYLLELINEILDLALIESGKAALSAEPVALADLLSECRTMMQPQAQQRGITVTFPRLAPPLYVNADRTRLKQSLINLLSNAIKYNRPGGTVTVESLPCPPDAIRISVRDTGDGMAPDLLRQLFQPFNRLGKEAGLEEGTGIGLVVTKRLVERMGGTVGVESTVGVGTVFWIELARTTPPQFAHHEPEGSETAALSAVQPLPEGTLRRTVLYVEDNPANLELVEQLIERRPDLRLLSAADGSLGIEFARAHRPDVILMDIHLPGISGVEAMKVLRADPATAHIPIIALSANAVPRDIAAGLEAGFFCYLTKPIKVSLFTEALDAALKSSDTEPGQPAEKETP
ncbi:MAG: PAS domain S-box protein [Comamonadaceae bacterium]|uniref:PAS domain S-box protein n=1 Tax=Candidatus Skiveiella danica TaxID=3386177 RepID=UPI00390AEE43|nr:PAS domain S-box protein [Comamonadaceae bacterium]